MHLSRRQIMSVLILSGFKQLLQAWALPFVLFFGNKQKAYAGAGLFGLEPIKVNDSHSMLNETVVSHIYKVRNNQDWQRAWQMARSTQKSLAIAGGRHSMGGQQFCSNNILVDTAKFNKLLKLDQENGIVEVQSGMYWSELVEELDKIQQNIEFGEKWVVMQKPTGADQISVGGSVSANAHGRVLNHQPLISDIKYLNVMKADGQIVNISRENDPELFKLVVGGYGLFAAILDVGLQLQKQCYLKRQVELTSIDTVWPKIQQAIKEGCKYGDFQFSIADKEPAFMREGILTVYKPVMAERPHLKQSHKLDLAEWEELVYLAHTDKSKAFAKYCSHYIKTNGQIYDSAKFQLSTYLDHYHKSLDKRLSDGHGSELITELYVPPEQLSDFMYEAGEYLRASKGNLIYGTVRFIEQDQTAFLAWAKKQYACIVLNLHIEHNQADIERNKKIFCGLIDLALKRGGNYYLTYHKYADNRQLLEGYPQFGEFLKLKAKYDPDQVFASNWYKQYQSVLNC